MKNDLETLKFDVDDRVRIVTIVVNAPNDTTITVHGDEIIAKQIISRINGMTIDYRPFTVDDGPTIGDMKG